MSNRMSNRMVLVKAIKDIKDGIATSDNCIVLAESEVKRMGERTGWDKITYMTEAQARQAKVTQDQIDEMQVRITKLEIYSKKMREEINELKLDRAQADVDMVRLIGSMI